MGITNIVIEQKLPLWVPAIWWKNIMEITVFITKKAFMNISHGFIVMLYLLYPKYDLKFERTL